MIITYKKPRLTFFRGGTFSVGKKTKGLAGGVDAYEELLVVHAWVIDTFAKNLYKLSDIKLKVNQSFGRGLWQYEALDTWQFRVKFKRKRDAALFKMRWVI